MKDRPRSREPADRQILSSATAPLPTEWLRLSIEHSPTAIGIVRGRAFTLAYANAAFRELSSLSGAPSGSIIERPLAEAFNPAATKSLISLLERARHDGVPVRARFAGDQLGVPGAWQCAAWSAADPAALAVHSDRSDPMVLEVDASSYSDQEEARHRDLTELVLLSAIREETRATEATAARSRAEAARAAQDRFLAEVSHEIRTPMQAIVGYARLIEMGVHGPVTDRQHEALARIREGTGHVINLISDLLEYASTAARPIEPALTTIDVLAALRAAESFVAPQAHAKGLVLRLGLGQAGATVRADAAKLLQIVLNLLTNAVKFTEPGGTITISWETVAAADGVTELVEIRVADTGRGITDDDLALVFDPFVQVGEQDQSSDKGVGLGLAISRALARGMSGDLVATSTPKVGSVFTLTLPRA